jgi:hypothetical protein
MSIYTIHYVENDKPMSFESSLNSVAAILDYYYSMAITRIDLNGSVVYLMPVVSVVTLRNLAKRVYGAATIETKYTPLGNRYAVRTGTGTSEYKQARLLACSLINLLH